MVFSRLTVVYENVTACLNFYGFAAQVWHRQCFKCTECGMTLNMKNYKGFEKMPYCSA